MTRRHPTATTARPLHLAHGVDRRARRPWQLCGISGLLLAGAAGCGSPHASPGPLPQLSTTVRSTGPALAASPLQLRLAPDAGTHSLTYTVTNAGSTATRATLELAASDTGVAVTTQQGTTCTPSAQEIVCDLGTLAAQDTVPVVLQEQSTQGGIDVPQACLVVPAASGPSGRGCLPSTTLDQATLSRLPSASPSGIQPFANLANSLRLFVNPGGAVPPAPASPPPSPGPRGGVTPPQAERELSVPFTNPSTMSVRMEMTIDVLDREGVPLRIVRAQPLQGAVHQGPSSDVPGPAPASGLTWDTGPVPPRGTATLLLFVEAGQSPFRVAGRFVIRSAGGKVSQGAWTSAVNGPSAGGPSPTSVPSATSVTSTRSATSTTRRVTSTSSSTSQGSRPAGPPTPPPSPPSTGGASPRSGTSGAAGSTPTPS